ncbi:MAG: cytidine deaminase [Bacteroidota bacterium]|nr:MAG: cytidine deaminase [Bacteroidota bacterium]
MNNQLIDLLIEKARAASRNSYSVYSKFPVGAAFINHQGEVFSGCNVENISFGLTMCAERTAIFSSIAQGNKSIDTMVIYTPTQAPTYPCGACRQVIAEFNPQARIICVCNTSERVDTTLDKLLPSPSLPVDLKLK